MTRYLCLGLLLAATSVGAQEATPALEPDLDAMFQKCGARLEELQQQAASDRRYGNILLIVGASIAALGSALAGFLNKSTHRKAMAIIGACGAVIAVLPKTLDDPTELLTRRATAERHHTAALKVSLQLPYLPLSYEAPGTQYAIARLVDCTNSTSPETVPTPPDVIEDPPTSPPPEPMKSMSGELSGDGHTAAAPPEPAPAPTPAPRRRRPFLAMAGKPSPPEVLGDPESALPVHATKAVLERLHDEISSPESSTGVWRFTIKAVSAQNRTFEIRVLKANSRIKVLVPSGLTDAEHDALARGRFTFKLK